MDDAQLEVWVDGVTRRYAELGQILLVGSRGSGGGRPDSDWDVVVCLGDDSYQAEQGRWAQRDRIEQRIAFDSVVCFEGLDLFFLRPGGEVGRWIFGPYDEPPALNDDALDQMARDGVAIGDFERLVRSLPLARVLWPSEVW